MADQSFLDYALEHEEKPEEKGFLDNIFTLAGQSGRKALASTSMADDVFTGNIDEGTAGDLAKELTAQQQDYQPEALKRMQGAFDDEAEDWKKAEGFFESTGVLADFAGEFGKQVFTNPAGLIYETANQAGNMAPVIAASLAGGYTGGAIGTAALPGWGTFAGAVGGAVGAGTGAFGASWTVEAGFKFQEVVGEELHKRGLEVNEQNIKTILEDKTFLDDAITRSRAKATGTAGTDAVLSMITGGVGMIPAKTAAKSIGKKVALTTMNTLGEGVSEGVGQYMAEGEIDPKEIALEIMAGGIGAYTETAGMAKIGIKNLNQKAKAELEAEKLAKETSAVVDGSQPETLNGGTPTQEEQQVDEQAEADNQQVDQSTADIEAELENLAEEQEDVHEPVKKAAKELGVDGVKLQEEALKENDADVKSFTARMVKAFGDKIKPLILKLWNYVKGIKIGLTTQIVNNDHAFNELTRLAKKKGPEWTAKAIERKQGILQKHLDKGKNEESLVVQTMAREIQILQGTLQPEQTSPDKSEPQTDQPPANSMAEEEVTTEEKTTTSKDGSFIPDALFASQGEVVAKRTQIGRDLYNEMRGKTVSSIQQKIEQLVGRYEKFDSLASSEPNDPNRFKASLVYSDIRTLRNLLATKNNPQEYIDNKNKKNTDKKEKEEARRKKTVLYRSEKGRVYLNSSKIVGMTKDGLFVFGSNEAGRHGMGAAKEAADKYGAIRGQGVGEQGQSYGIPTKDKNLKILSLAQIKVHVDNFLAEAAANPEKKYYLTAIGTGLSKYDAKDIAPMFTESTKNILLPSAWEDVIENYVDKNKEEYTESFEEAETDEKIIAEYNESVDEEYSHEQWRTDYALVYGEENLKKAEALVTKTQEENIAPVETSEQDTLNAMYDEQDTTTQKSGRDPKFTEVFDEDLNRYARLHVPMDITERRDQKKALLAVEKATTGKYLSVSEYETASNYLDKYNADTKFDKKTKPKTTIVRKGAGVKQEVVEQQVVHTPDKTEEIALKKEELKRAEGKPKKTTKKPMRTIKALRKKLGEKRIEFIKNSLVKKLPLTTKTIVGFKETLIELAVKDKFLIDSNITEDERTALYAKIYQDMLYADRNEEVETKYDDLETSNEISIQDRLDEGEGGITPRPWLPSHQGQVSETQQNIKAEGLVNRELEEKNREFSPLVSVRSGDKREKANYDAIVLANNQMKVPPTDSEGKPKPLLTLGDAVADETSIREMIIDKLLEYSKFRYNVPLIIKRAMLEKKTLNMNTLTEYPVLFDEIDSYLATMYGEEHLNESESQEAIDRAEFNVKHREDPDAADKAMKARSDAQEKKVKKEVRALKKAGKPVEKPTKTEKVLTDSEIDEAEIKRQEVNKKKRETLETREGKRLYVLYQQYKQVTKLTATVPEIFSTMIDVVNQQIENIGITTAKELNPNQVALLVAKEIKKDNPDAKYLELSHEEQEHTVKLAIKIANSIRTGETFTSGKEAELYLAETIESMNESTQLGELVDIAIIDNTYESPDAFKFLNMGGQFVQDVEVDYGDGVKRSLKFQKNEELLELKNNLKVHILEKREEDGPKYVGQRILYFVMKNGVLVKKFENHASDKRIKELQEARSFTEVGDKQNFSDNMVIDAEFFDYKNETWKDKQTIPHLDYRRILSQSEGKTVIKRLKGFNKDKSPIWGKPEVITNEQYASMSDTARERVRVIDVKKIRAADYVQNHPDHGKVIKAKRRIGFDKNNNPIWGKTEFLTYEAYSRILLQGKSAIKPVGGPRKAKHQLLAGWESNKEGLGEDTLQLLHDEAVLQVGEGVIASEQMTTAQLQEVDDIFQQKKAEHITKLVTEHIKKSPFGNENVLDDAVKALKAEGIVINKLHLLDAYIKTGGDKIAFYREIGRLTQEFHQKNTDEIYNSNTNPSESQVMEYLSNNLNTKEREALKQLLEIDKQPKHKTKVQPNINNLQRIKLETIKQTYYHILALNRARIMKDAPAKKTIKADLAKHTTQTYAERGIDVNPADVFEQKLDELSDVEKEIGVSVGKLRIPAAQKLYEAIAKFFKADLVVVSSPNYRSRYIVKAKSDGRPKIVVNMWDKTPFVKVFAHEMFHHIVNRANQKEYQAFKKAFYQMVKEGEESALSSLSPTASHSDREKARTVDKLRMENQERASALIDKIEQGDDIMQEEVLAELFAWATTQKSFYEHLSRTAGGKSLAKKLLLRIIKTTNKVSVLQPDNGSFTYAGVKLLGNGQLNEMYELIHDLVDDSLSARSLHHDETRYHTLNATKAEVEGYLKNTKNWLNGAWRRVFPKGTKNYKDVMTALERLMVDALKVINKMKPKGFANDWLSDKEDARLAQVIANTAERAVARAKAKTKKHRKVFKNFVTDKQAQLVKDIENGVWYYEDDESGVRSFKKGKAPEGAVVIDSTNEEHKYVINNLKDLHSHENLMRRMHDDFVRGGIDVSTDAGRATALEQGYPQEVIDAFAQFQEISNEIFKRLSEQYPKLGMLASHYGQSIKWYHLDGNIVDDTMDAVINPELNNKVTKAHGSTQFQQEKNLDMSTAEIAEKHKLFHKTIDPMELFAEYVRDAERLISMNRMLSEGKASGRIQVFSNALQAAERGFHAVNDNATKIMRNLETIEGFKLVDEDGIAFKKNGMDLTFNTKEEASSFYGLMSKTDKQDFTIQEVSQEGKSAIPFYAVYRNGELIDYFNSEEEARSKAAEMQDKFGFKGTKENQFKDAINYVAKGAVVNAKESEVARYYFKPDLAKMLNGLFAKDHFRGGKFMGVSGNTWMNVKNHMTSIEFALSGFHFLTIAHEMMASYLSWSYLKNKQLGAEGIGLSKRIKELGPMRIWKESREITTLLDYVMENENADRTSEEVVAAQKRLGEILKIKNVDAIDLLDMFFHSGGLTEQDRSLRASAHDVAKMKYREDETITLDKNGEAKFNATRGINGKVMMESLKEAIESEKAKHPNNPLIQSFNVVRFVGMESGTAWLMEGFIPKVKMAMWAREYTLRMESSKEAIAKGETTKEEIARDSMKFIEDRFGETNWKNMWMDPSLKSSMQFLFRSFTWFAGSWKALGKAGIDMGKVGWFKLKGEEHVLTEKGWWGINALLIHMLTVAAINVAFVAVTSVTGEDDDDEREDDIPMLTKLLFPRLDPLDPAGRVTVPSYITELYKIMVHTGMIGVHAEPYKLVSGRTNSLISNSFEALITGEDWRGVKVRNPEDGLVMDAINTMTHIFGVLPISISTIMSDARTHGFRPDYLGYGMLGITSAPASAKRSNAVNLAYVLRREEHSGRAVTDDVMDVKDETKRAAYKFSRGNRKPLNDLVMNEKITMRQWENAIKRLPTIEGKTNPLYIDPLTSALKSLSIEGTLQVWDVMNKREKKRQRMLIFKKFQNVKKRGTRSNKKQKEILAKMREVGVIG